MSEELNEMSKLAANSSGLDFDLFIENSGEFRITQDQSSRIKFKYYGLGDDSKTWPSLVIPNNGNTPYVPDGDKAKYKIPNNNSKVSDMIKLMTYYRKEFMEVWNAYSEEKAKAFINDISKQHKERLLRQ